MEFGLECADTDLEDYVARVSWEWTADEGGSSPGDRVSNSGRAAFHLRSSLNHDPVTG